MSQPLMKVLAPPSTPMPRGAMWAAAGAVWLARLLTARGSASRKQPGPGSARAVLSRQ